jgi:hypothetical protein
MPFLTSDEPLRVNSDLVEAEAALDSALQKQSKLLSTLVAARQGLGEPFVGQEALMRLVRSQQSLLAAGGDLARVHFSLLKIGREMGAVIHDCPKNQPMKAKQQLPADDSPGSFDLNKFLPNDVAFA